jgi:hypothetical protein
LEPFAFCFRLISRFFSLQVVYRQGGLSRTHPSGASWRDGRVTSLKTTSDQWRDGDGVLMVTASRPGLRKIGKGSPAPRSGLLLQRSGQELEHLLCCIVARQTEVGTRISSNFRAVQTGPRFFLYPAGTDGWRLAEEFTWQRVRPVMWFRGELSGKARDECPAKTRPAGPTLQAHCPRFA